VWEPGHSVSRHEGARNGGAGTSRSRVTAGQAVRRLQPLNNARAAVDNAVGRLTTVRKPAPEAINQAAGSSLKRRLPRGWCRAP
jgi:hypothetical protein